MIECKDCKFYKIDPKNVAKGSCHKKSVLGFAALAISPTGSLTPVFMSSFPECGNNYAMSGCGEGEPKN